MPYCKPGNIEWKIDPDNRCPPLVGTAKEYLVNERLAGVEFDFLAHGVTANGFNIVWIGFRIIEDAGFYQIVSIEQLIGPEPQRLPWVGGRFGVKD